MKSTLSHKLIFTKIYLILIHYHMTYSSNFYFSQKMKFHKKEYLNFVHKNTMFITYTMSLHNTHLIYHDTISSLSCHKVRQKSIKMHYKINLKTNLIHFHSWSLHHNLFQIQYVNELFIYNFYILTFSQEKHNKLHTFLIISHTNLI